MNRGRHTGRAASPTGVSLFEVVVGGGVGPVYRGWDEIAANEFFDIYVALSVGGDTRAADESVELLQDGAVARYFVGALDVIRGWRARAASASWRPASTPASGRGTTTRRHSSGA